MRRPEIASPFILSFIARRIPKNGVRDLGSPVDQAPNHTMQRIGASRLCQFQFSRPCRLAPSADGDRYRDVKLHSALFGWSDPDQALRVAAGIPGKRASGGQSRIIGTTARGAKPSRQCIEPGSLNPG
jgi:hypothetical protein